MPSGVYPRKKEKVGKSLGERPVEEAREIQRAGGIASGVSKRKTKLIRDTIGTVLSLPINDAKAREELAKIGITDEDMTQQTLMILGVMKRAKTGDPLAATFIRDSIGQKEAEKLDFVQPVQIVVKDDYGDAE